MKKVKNEKKGYQPKNKLTKDHVIKIYETIIQILEDRTNTRITYTIK